MRPAGREARWRAGVEHTGARIDGAGDHETCEVADVDVLDRIERRSGWEEVKAFSRAVAERLAADRPDEFTSKLPKK